MALTPQTVLRERILVTLAGLPGGSASRADTLKALDHAYSAEWTPEDLQAPDSRPWEGEVGEPRQLRARGHGARWLTGGSGRRIDGLTDSCARHGLMILGGTGLRLCELLDLELDCLLDFAGHDSWLKVPLGKHGTERTVSLDETTLAILWSLGRRRLS